MAMLDVIGSYISVRLKQLEPNERGMYWAPPEMFEPVVNENVMAIPVKEVAGFIDP